MLSRIEQLLCINGISAKQLLTELGLSNSAISEWKKGKAKPSLSAVTKIADYFNVSIDYLVNGESPKNENFTLFKEKFICLCDEKALSPSFVCHEIGISSTAFSYWSDKAVPRKETLMKIADYFDVSINYFVSNEYTDMEYNYDPKNNSLDQIINRIFSLMRLQNKNKTDLTHAIGRKPPATVCGWEKRRSRPTIEQIIKLSEYFNVSTDYILTGKENNTFLSLHQQEMLDLFSQLNQGDQREIRGFMNIVDRIKKVSNKTLAEIEKSLSFGNGTIGKWSKASPSVNKLSLVANHLGVSIDYLVNGTTENNDLHQTQLLRMFNQLNNDEQCEIIGRIKQMIDSSQKSGQCSDVCIAVPSGKYYKNKTITFDKEKFI